MSHQINTPSPETDVCTLSQSAFLLLSGCLYSDPVREVKRLAKELKMDGKVCVANCTSKLTPESLADIVTECYQNNYWLILQNYHMCPSDVHLQLASILKVTRN